MLSKSDKKYLEQTIEHKLDEKLNQKFDEKLKPIHDKLNRVEKNLSQVDKNLTELSEYVIPALGNIFRWTDDIHKALIGKSSRAVNEN